LLLKPFYMKRTLLSLVVIAACSAGAYANNTDPGIGGKGKKDDVNGIVTDADEKKPLKDVSITAYLSSKKEKVVFSDEEGGYAFDELKPGTYKFVFEKTGYKKVVREKVIVKVDEGFQLRVEMLEDKDTDLMPSPFHFY
jgi:Carboxypeptidase regulatory-like domain